MVPYRPQSSFPNNAYKYVWVTDFIMKDFDGPNVYDSVPGGVE